MSMANETTTTFQVALRVEAKRAPPSTQDLWDLALDLANAEIHKQVSKVVKGLLGSGIIADVDTILVNICQPKLCAEVEAFITIRYDATRFPTPVVDYLVVGALRLWVEENKNAYKHISEAQVTWLGPDRIATLVGWHVDGVSSTMSSGEAGVFDLEAKNFLNQLIVNSDNKCDKVVVLDQFIGKSLRLEIHTALLGTSKTNSIAAYQYETLRVLNNNEVHSFVQVLDSSDPFFEPAFRVQAFALDYANITERNKRLSPTASWSQRSSYLTLDFLDTTNIAIGLAFVAIGVLIAGSGFVAFKKRAPIDNYDDETSAAES
jgi:hypothetical protein